MGLGRDFMDIGSKNEDFLLQQSKESPFRPESPTIPTHFTYMENKWKLVDSLDGMDNTAKQPEMTKFWVFAGLRYTFFPVSSCASATKTAAKGPGGPLTMCLSRPLLCKHSLGSASAVWRPGMAPTLGNYVGGVLNTLFPLSRLNLAATAIPGAIPWE